MIVTKPSNLPTIYTFPEVDKGALGPRNWVSSPKLSLQFLGTVIFCPLPPMSQIYKLDTM